jgi:hypothetical protein
MESYNIDWLKTKVLNSRAATNLYTFEFQIYLTEQELYKIYGNTV